jgi:hypothetical protein
VAALVIADTAVGVSVTHQYTYCMPVIDFKSKRCQRCVHDSAVFIRALLVRTDKKDSVAV